MSSETNMKLPDMWNYQKEEAANFARPLGSRKNVCYKVNDFRNNTLYKSHNPHRTEVGTQPLRGVHDILN